MWVLYNVVCLSSLTCIYANICIAWCKYYGVLNVVLHIQTKWYIKTRCISVCSVRGSSGAVDFYLNFLTISQYFWVQRSPLLQSNFKVLEFNIKPSNYVPHTVHILYIYWNRNIAIVLYWWYPNNNNEGETLLIYYFYAFIYLYLCGFITGYIIIISIIEEEVSWCCGSAPSYIRSPSTILLYSFYTRNT